MTHPLPKSLIENADLCASYQAKIAAGQVPTIGESTAWYRVYGHSLALKAAANALIDKGIKFEIPV